jgi:isocitrate dehydrogenase
MATIRQQVEDVYAAVAFAERGSKEEAVQLAKSAETKQADRKEETRKDKRPRASLRAE